MQSIDLHVQQVNKDQYASLGIPFQCLSCCASNADVSQGNFLFQNYKQALDTQLNFGHKLHLFWTTTGFAATDFLHWHQEETAFLSITKWKEPGELSLKVSYVEAMEKVYAIE